MPIVKFIKEKKEIEVPEGANLRAEAKKAGINLNQGVRGVSDTIDNFACAINKHMNCKGLGMCGTCRVLITKGMENTNEMTMREKLKFKSPVPLPVPVSVPVTRRRAARGCARRRASAAPAARSPRSSGTRRPCSG